MQLDHVLKKLNFDILTLSPRVVGEGGTAGKTCKLLLASSNFCRFLNQWNHTTTKRRARSGSQTVYHSDSGIPEWNCFVKNKNFW